MSFPLLRLPSVAVRCVLKQVNQNDATKLGFCSKRAKNLVKYQRRVPSEKPLLLMVFGTRYEVRIIRRIMIFVKDLSKIPENIEYWTIDGEKVPVSTVGNEIYNMYFENRLSGTQKLVSYLSDIFNIPIYRLYITLMEEDKRSDARIAIDWVMSRQESVQSIQLIVDSAAGVKDDFRYVWNKCRATEKIGIGPRYDPSMNPLLTRNKMLFSWLTVDDLIQSDCQSICIPNLTNVELNQFLKSWMNGGNPKLAHLEVCLEKLDIEMITSGLSATKVTREEPVRLVLGTDESYEITNRWDITRNDGRKMSIGEYWKSLICYVWPEH